jgi:hypothetical protein
LVNNARSLDEQSVRLRNRILFGTRTWRAGESCAALESAISKQLIVIIRVARKRLKILTSADQFGSQK